VADLADRWQRDFLTHKRKDKGAAVMASLRLHVLPTIGAARLVDLRKLHVLHIVNAINGAGTGRTAALTLATLRQMFGWAIRCDYMAADPTAGLLKSEYGGKPTIRTRVLASAELKDLARRMHQTYRGGPVGRERDIPMVPLTVQAATWVMLSTLARVGELSQARWEHIDAEAGTWYVPPDNSKNGRAHLIHLSEFAARHLAYLRTLACGSDWVLPSRDGKEHLDLKAITKALGDRQAEGKPHQRRSSQSSALALPGGAFTAHDLRRTGATLMQSLGVAAPIIERCLNHTETNRMVKTYQQDELLPQRAAAFTALGRKLDELVPASATAHLKVQR
jgi:integrase